MTPCRGTLRCLHFGLPVSQLPALADWLRARGCTDLRYGVAHQHRELNDLLENPGEL